ncbi:hypothetical protein HYC85_029017 [Camellia sinensis]|uniref:Uncharacterized protein n=1 Tax=Camellia sinensis TaxID=4442 RepID=A0A7J7G0S1_CAMSI|nr:hypothetical protein HYC85_029017 [Camellia sinensis]
MMLHADDEALICRIFLNSLGPLAVRWRREQLQVDRRRTRRAGKKYTALSELISTVMSKVQHLPFFKWPSKMVRPSDMRRRDRRCEYHKDHGHDTKSCYALKDHLEELVQDGRLKQYIRKDNSTKTRDTVVRETTFVAVRHFWKSESRRRNWSADQVFWQADHLLWFPPQKVVGRWSPMPISWSAAFPQIPRVEFHLLEVLCKFLRSIANKGELGHRDGFPDKAT